MYGKKAGESIEVAQSLHKDFPNSEFPVLVLASLYYRENNFEKCNEVLNEYISSFPKNCLQSQLSLAHIPLSRGDLTQAIQLLQQIPSLAHKPALVATLVALYERVKDTAAATRVFDQALAFWSQKIEARDASQSLSRATFLLLLEKAAHFKLKHQQYADSMSMYEKLVNELKTDRSANSERQQRIYGHMVQAAAKINPHLATQLCSKLPPLPGLESIDVSSLESVSAPRSETLRRERRTERKKGTKEEEKKEDEKKKSRKRKRKKRLPKKFDPNNPGPMPDEERWLPRFERKSFSKKGRRRKQQFRGSQGSLPGETPTGVTTTATTASGVTTTGITGGGEAAPVSTGTLAPRTVPRPAKAVFRKKQRKRG